MNRPARFATVTATAGAVLFLAAPGALAQEVADEYSGGVEPRVIVRTETPPVVKPSVTTTSSTATSPSTLPFTGGEVVLVGGLGAGALAAGVLMVAAGRRRSHA